MIRNGLALFVLAVLGWSQTNVGRISGTVTDPSRAAVAGCKVLAVNLQTGLQSTAITQESGLYIFASLLAGTYDLIVDKEGFRSARQTGVVLDAASQRTLDFVLEIGSVTESVSVSAAVEQVQTNSGEVGKVITDRQLSQIALNGRNYAQLLRLIPGAMATNLDPFALALSVSGQRINGVRTASIYTTVDGAENVDNGGNGNAVVNPNVDTIAEVKILTSSYSAEFGGRAGAMVNVVTKTGTREFHGTLFEFVRNDKFDARSFFSRGRDPLRFNNFGWTLGGPIFIPKKWNTDRNKLFFYASQEWKYNHQGVTRLSVVPTAAERNGDFRGSPLTAPIDPLTGQPFPDRVVPASRFSRNGPLLLEPFPVPNFTGSGGNYSATGVNRTDTRQDLIKADYILSSNTQITYRWTHDTWDIFDAYQGGSLGVVPGARPRPGYSTMISATHSFSPTMLNSFSFGLTHNIIRAGPVNEVMKRSTLGLTYPEIFPSNFFGTGPTVDIAGFTGYNPGDGLHKYYATFQWRDDFTKVAGSHTLKFGFQISRSRNDENNLSVNEQGRVTFNTSARNSTRNAIADVLLGNFQNYTEEMQSGSFWSRFNQWEFYAQDSWKATSRLSLEFGLRYNIIEPNYSALGNESSFIPSLYDPAKAPQISPADGSIVLGTGDPYNGIAIWGDEFPERGKGRIPQATDPSMQRLFLGVPRGGAAIYYRDFAPRFGFAYDPFGGGKTSIRGGFGISYDRISQNNLLGPSRNPPFSVTANVFDGNIDNPGGSTARSFPSNLITFPVDRRNPQVMSFNLGVQRELPKNVILDVGYVGTLGRNLPRTIDINQLREGARLNPPNSQINVNALRRYQGYGSISLSDHGDNSNYNSLQVSASQRMRSGLSFGAAYTFSKTLDSSSGTPQEAYNARPDYGLSTIHRAHVLTLNYIYELPFFRNHPSGALKAVAAGWELSGVTFYQSGAPNDVTVPVDVARIGASSSRASVIGDPKLPGSERSVARWFNTEAFLPPERMVQGRFGNSGRGVVIGPAFSQWDLALMKNFNFGEKARVQFRAESFNVFNHASFTSINTTVRFDSAGRPSQNYGAITGSGPGRVLEFGLKLLF